MRRSALPPGKPLERRTGFLTVVRDIDSAAARKPSQARASRKRTGFPDAVKLAVRKRAGGGDPDQARCEACGTFLGCHDGQIQHRMARGMGGTSLPMTDSIVNAALLCGTPSTGCHGLAERRDRLMNAHGYWLRAGEDPAGTPIMLASQYGSGVTVWLTPLGGYSPLPPFGGAA